MINPQQALWQLNAGEALTLPIGPGVRLLRVSEGRLWLTQSGSSQAPAKDVWLQAGESVQLASGSQVVLEAWPRAAFQLLVPPSACSEVQRARALAAVRRRTESALSPALAV